MAQTAATRERRFLNELTRLTRLHRVAVWGCGCCGSPSLEPLDASQCAGEYDFEEDGSGAIRWSGFDVGD